MVVTQNDLHSFNEFVAEKLKNGSAESLEELVHQWRVVREREEVNAAIQSGIADVDAGRTRPLEEFWDEFSQKHDISPDP